MLAEGLLRLFGERRAPLALSVASLLFGFPIFLDAAFVVMLPIIFSVARRLGGSVLVYALPATGAFLVMHALLPPHPGPVAAAEIVGADMGLVIVLGLAIGIPTWYLAGHLLGLWLGRRFDEQQRRRRFVGFIRLVGRLIEPDQRRLQLDRASWLAYRHDREERSGAGCDRRIDRGLPRRDIDRGRFDQDAQVRVRLGPGRRFLGLLFRGIGLEFTQAQVDGRGFIVCDEQCRTDDSRIWAIGDVAGEPMLAHRAMRQGKIAAEAIALRSAGRADHQRGRAARIESRRKFAQRRRVRRKLAADAPERYSFCGRVPVDLGNRHEHRPARFLHRDVVAARDRSGHVFGTGPVLTQPELYQALAIAPAVGLVILLVSAATVTAGSAVHMTSPPSVTDGSTAGQTLLPEHQLLTGTVVSALVLLGVYVGALRTTAGSVRRR